MCVGPCHSVPWSVQTRPALPPRSIAIEIESARSRLPPLVEQKIPFVQIPPTCMTLLDAAVWLNFGVAEVPLVVCAKVTYHREPPSCVGASVGIVSGVLSQMKSTRPALPAVIHGK